jgi:replicative DNA helicase
MDDDRRKKANLKGSVKEDRLPPNDQHAEQAVLGCIILSAACISLCIEKIPDSEVFYSLPERIIYETMLSMHADGVPIDTVSLRRELLDLCKLEEVGGLAFIAGLPETVPAAANIDYYIEILREKFTLRRAIGLATEAVTRAYDHQGEVDQLVDDLTSNILELSNSTQQVTTLHRSNQLVPLSINWAENAQQNQGQLSGIATGFVDFDTITNGLQNGEMIVIAARPSVGKSSLCMNVADYVAVNLNIPVCVFSLEMSALSLMNRAACSRARVPMNLVRRGQMHDVHYGRLTSAYAQLNHAPLFIDDASGTNINKLQAKARRYHQQYGIRLFVIDYLQMMTARAESRQQEITAISGGIKALTKELNVPVIVASQLNREVDKDKKGRKPRLSDIRESGSIEQDADIVGLLYRPKEVDDDQSDDSHSEKVNLILAKNRNGEIAELPLVFIKSYTRFETAAHTSET